MVLQGGNVDAARGLAYLLNANLTLSGGCPYPPLSAHLAQEVHLPILETLPASIRDCPNSCILPCDRD